MIVSEWEKFPDDDVDCHTQLTNNVRVGFWQYSINAKQFLWSAGVYQLLRYEPGEIPTHYNFFVDALVHPEDRAKLNKAFSRHIANRNDFTVHLRLLSRNNKYCWYDLAVRGAQKQDNDRVSGTLTNIHELKHENQFADSTLSMGETVKLAKVGGWELDADTFTLAWSKEVFDMYELPASSKPDARRAISYFEPGYREVLTHALTNTIQHKQPCDVEALLRTAGNRRKWVRIKGMPVTDNNSKCIKVRGIMQDIDEIKSKENALQSSLEMLNDQNKRLQNFAYIVSHNLRSHTGNLQYMVDLYHTQTQASANDCGEILNNIQAISKNLNVTIEHLNEIVQINNSEAKERRDINLETVFNHTTAVLDANINAAGAKLTADFSACLAVCAIPAYIDSIFLNMLSNAVKYTYPGRTPEIKIRSYHTGNEVHLIFEDNGIGIDLNKYGNKLFGMYKTFHRNADSKGLGLFMTRNQVEALGGKIEVESIVNEGTKFTIKLKQ